MTCDHLTPKSSYSRGESPNKAENLDTLCAICNTRKERKSVEQFLEEQRLASLFYSRKSELSSKKFNPDDLEWMTVRDVMSILRKLPPTMRFALEKAPGGFGMPIRLSLDVKPYAKWTTSNQPEQQRVFLGYDYDER